MLVLLLAHCVLLGVSGVTINPSKSQTDRLRSLLASPERTNTALEQIAVYKELLSKDAAKLGSPGFDCPDKVSPSQPTSVHALRPGDIKIVGAIGDSLSAGNGAKAWNIVQLLFNYRGQAFTLGGDDNLSKLVTLPNVLRSFNPKLQGYSTGISTSYNYRKSRFNVAVPGSEATDLADQAVRLVKRLKAKLSNDSFHNDWKMVMVFIGGNDLCNYCTDKETYAPDKWASAIADAIRILQNDLHKVLFNVVGPIHVELSRKLSRGHPVCRGIHWLFECPCIETESFTDEDFYNVTLSYYHQMEAQLVTSGQFERADSTVVVQPFLVGATEPPYTSDGKLDISFVAPDCFHLSSKGHDHFGRFLWNNMLEPIGGKSFPANLSQAETPLLCPDPKCPFIRTTGNSKSCVVKLPTFDRRKGNETG